MTEVEFTRTPPTKAGHPRMAAGFAFVYAGHHSRQQVSERRPAPTKANPHTTFFRDTILVSNNLNPRPLILRNFSFLKGLSGDHMNAVLTAAGSNLQKLLRAIAHALIFWLITQLESRISLQSSTQRLAIATA